MLKSFVTALALALAVCASASDGRIPIGTMPYTITAPGSYYLTGDLAASGGSVITISSAGVNLDLNGHYVWQGAGAGTCIASNGYSDIKIVNGTLVGGYPAISMQSVPLGVITLDHLTVRGSQGGLNVNGSGSGSASTYPTVQITNNSVTLAASAPGECIHFQYVQGGRVSGNTLVGGTNSGSGGNGISSFQANNLIVSENSVTNTSYALDLYGANNTISGNTCYGNIAGIACFGSFYLIVFDNNTSGNAQGIWFQNVSGVYRNNVSQNNSISNYNITSSTINNGGGNY